MANKTQQDPKHVAARYSDPLGEHMRSASVAQSRRESRYPNVNEALSMFYLDFKPTKKVGERYLGSSDGLVGSELTPKHLTDAQAGEDSARGDVLAGEGLDGQEGEHGTSDEQATEGHTIGFYDYGGHLVATFDSPELSLALKNNWKIRCILAYSVFSAQEKSPRGTAACFCYDPTLDKNVIDALEVFIDRTVERMTASTYLKLKLSQEQFIKIIESDGKWFLINELPWPKLPKGTVYYRRRRTLIERLIDVANRGNKGCLVASWIGMFAIIAAIVLAVWLIFF